MSFPEKAGRESDVAEECKDRSREKVREGLVSQRAAKERDAKEKTRLSERLM